MKPVTLEWRINKLKKKMDKAGIVLNPPLSLDEINEFENKYNVKFPLDYKAFLTEIGDGGEGPYDGLYSIEKSLIETIPRRDLLKDNLFKGGDLLHFCHEGCGYYVAIQLNGKEKSQLWIDTRAGDGDIEPLLCSHEHPIVHIDFLSWYEDWVDLGVKSMRDPIEELTF